MDWWWFVIWNDIMTENKTKYDVFNSFTHCPLYNSIVCVSCWFIYNWLTQTSSWDWEGHSHMLRSWVKWVWPGPHLPHYCTSASPHHMTGQFCCSVPQPPVPLLVSPPLQPGSSGQFSFENVWLKSWFFHNNYLQLHISCQVIMLDENNKKAFTQLLTVANCRHSF